MEIIPHINVEEDPDRGQMSMLCYIAGTLYEKATCFFSIIMMLMTYIVLI